MATVIVVTNQKGGVGKTTTCAALAGIFRSRDKTVLAIDMDPQEIFPFLWALRTRAIRSMTL